MPKSRVRKKADRVEAPARTAPSKPGPSPAWLAPLMLVLFAIGVLWLVVYYIGGGEAPGQSSLGPWNLAVGFGFIIGGFVLATRWR